MSLNFPNIISLIRVLISPVFFVLIISNDPVYKIIACLLFVVAALTDYIDGWYARKYKLVTKAGKFIDPLADKFLTTAAFIAFVILDIVPLWMVLIILVRDIGTTLLRIYADSIKKPIVTSWSAKIKPFLQMSFISLILALILIVNAGMTNISGARINSFIHSGVVYIIMLALTVLTAWTAIEYLIQNRAVLSRLWGAITKKPVHEQYKN